MCTASLQPSTVHQVDDSCTSRKHGKKEPQSFSHCGSFDHPDVQSLNDHRLLFFILPLQKSNVLWAPKYLKYQLVSQEKQICSCLATAKHGGQKNHNGKNNCGSFFAMFSTSVG